MGAAGREAQWVLIRFCPVDPAIPGFALGIIIELSKKLQEKDPRECLLSFPASHPVITATLPAISHVKFGMLDAGKGWIVKGDARKNGNGEGKCTNSAWWGRKNQQLVEVSAPELAGN